MKRFLENLSAERLIISAIVIIAFLVLFVFLGSVKRKVIDQTKNTKDTKNVLVRKIVTFARTLIVLFAFLTVSQINGINLGSIIAGLGILSAVIGLALQDFLKDIIMGIHIVSDKFFSIGDVVIYNGEIGTVVGFSLTATKIQLDLDKSEITISNRNISEIRRIDDRFVIDLPLSYEDDAERIHEILENISKSIKEIKGIKGCTFAGTQKFEDSDVLYRFFLSCDPQKQSAMRRKANFLIQKELKNNNIKIPYNKLDVNIKEENHGN